MNRPLLVLCLVAALLSGLPAHADDNHVRVGVFISAPFVMQRNGALTGFSIELWDEIAAQLNLNTSYEIVNDIDEIEKALRSGRVQLTVSPIFMTASRSSEFDYSYAFLQTGFRVMVRSDTTGPLSHPLLQMLEVLFSWSTFFWLGIAMLLVLIPAHLVWLFERRHQNCMLADRAYIPGIFEAMFWAASILTTQAEVMPRHRMARFVALFWMFAGVVFVAFYTAQLTTTMTLQQIQGSIAGPRDLAGKRVGTLIHSAAGDLLHRQRAEVVEYDDIESLFRALMNRDIAAAVSNGPALAYFASHEGRGLVSLVGPQFESAPMVMLLPLGSPLRKQIDAALLRLYEDGTYQQLQDRWFGNL